MTMTFTATFGLMPGYGEFTYQPHHHDGPVAEAVCAAIEAELAENEVVIGCVVTPARVFYPAKFGCPAQGETVVTVAGAHNPKFTDADSWRYGVLNVINSIKRRLKQERVTLTFSPAEVIYLEPAE